MLAVDGLENRSARLLACMLGLPAHQGRAIPRTEHGFPTFAKRQALMRFLVYSADPNDPVWRAAIQDGVARTARWRNRPTEGARVLADLRQWRQRRRTHHPSE
jgi:hypothetical protein